MNPRSAQKCPPLLSRGSSQCLSSKIPSLKWTTDHPLGLLTFPFLKGFFSCSYPVLDCIVYLLVEERDFFLFFLLEVTGTHGVVSVPD